MKKKLFCQVTVYTFASSPLLQTQLIMPNKRIFQITQHQDIIMPIYSKWYIGLN